MLLSGMGWGCSEAVINPLTTTLYPEDKTHKLNVLHAWWPAGIIIGGLAGLAIGALNLDWRFKFAVVLLPATALIFLLLTTGRFPKTERAAAGIPASEMFWACLTPAFLLWFLAMFLTSAAELAPGQWVDMALTRTVGMSGIWLLVYVSGLMFVMRHFAGTMVHKLSSVGLLWVSCLLAAVGLVALSVANSPVMGFLAATIWGIGVCYMWPTMLAVASERFPRSGALGMGLIGTAGSLSIYFLLPQMGKIFDKAKIEAAGGEAAFTALSGDALNAVLAQASTASFRIVAFMPAVLLIVFGLVWLNDRRKGGFKPERHLATVDPWTPHCEVVLRNSGARWCPHSLSVWRCSPSPRPRRRRPAAATVLHRRRVPVAIQLRHAERLSPPQILHPATGRRRGDTRLRQRRQDGHLFHQWCGTAVDEETRGIRQCVAAQSRRRSF